ncbi:MAG: pyruvate kinase [Acidobacteriota bacterium]|nr:pyruvate kinase [Acidobacteriota bacterium]
MRLYKKTKIVATLGPASSSPEVIERMISAGVDVFRLNFSHGHHDGHAKNIRSIRRITARLRMHAGILADLQGPKIRTGKTADDRSIRLEKGATVRLVSGTALCDESTISLNYPRLLKDVQPGHRVLINDGLIRLDVRKSDIKTGFLECLVANTGIYSSNKGVNLPDSKLRVPGLTPKDKADLAFALEHKVNFVALSFVRRREDVHALSALVRRAKARVCIIAKIEKPEAVGNFADILDESDGIMVARGDLGVEISPSRVPLLQKQFITEANRRGKTVIVATQMLESMIQNPRPTRAEASDVANAILDGTDAIMLSGETAAGAYPVEAVRIMSSIAQETENSRFFPQAIADLSIKDAFPPHAICEAAQWASRDLGGVPVIVFTKTGETARYLAKIRNRSRILAFTPHRHIAERLSICWNTEAFVLNFHGSSRVVETRAESVLLERKLVRDKDLVLVVSGAEVVRDRANSLRIKRVGEKAEENRFSSV